MPSVSEVSLGGRGGGVGGRGGGGDLQLDAFLPSCLCVEPSPDSLFTVVFSASLLLIVFLFSNPSHPCMGQVNPLCQGNLLGDFRRIYKVIVEK